MVRARHFARDLVRSGAPSSVSADHIDTVVLVVSELVTNGVRYGTEPGDSVRLVLDASPARTVVECHDPVRRWPRPRSESRVRDRGRGLQILDALCPRLWGVRDREFGKTVWAAILAGPDDQPVGDVLGVHSFLCGACHSGRECRDARALATATVRAAR